MQPYFDFLPTSDLGIAVLIISIITVVMAACGYLLRDVLFPAKKQSQTKHNINMKKPRILFTLVMAVVMMAMNTQRVWAEEECTHEWEHMDNIIHLCKKCDSFESHKIDEDGGTCVCGFVCPGHDFSIDTDAIYNELKTTGKHILASKCNYCHYVVSEDLEDLIYGACDAGYEQHDWFVDLVLPTCTSKGYSVYICDNCTFAYYDDFIDADPDAHYFYPGDDGEHYCQNGCGQSGAHTMEEERCTVCGYWPDHTEHDWGFDDFDHQCIIPGCDEFRWFAPHEFDGCVCTICGYATHKYENGKCVKCNSECEHDWEIFNDYSHFCNKCNYNVHHKIDEDGGTCVCGYKCARHDYNVDINETRQACVNNSKIIVVYRCDFCNHSKTEEVEIESVCENGDKHSWVESNYEATCKNSGYTKVKCFDCRLEYYKNFTDINPDAHSWDADESEHRCSNKCEAYYEWESHEYDENGQCEVCGYWPDHEQHRWETTKKGHHCSIPGCEVYGEWSDHTFDADGKCTICGAEAIYEATATIGGNTTSYLDFNDALTDAIDAGSAATVVLQSDVALPGNKVYWLDKNNRIILDLNGKTLKFESGDRLFSLNGCNLTITDSSEEKEGTIESYNTILDAYLGTLTIHAGTFKSRYHQALRINTSQLSVTIDGGRFITGSTDCSSISTVQQPDPAEGYYYVATGSGNFLSPGDDGNLVDQDGNIVTDITVIHQHSLTFTDAQPATCATAGNHAYWTCSTCMKVFSDENATTETTIEDQTIAANIPHTFDEETDPHHTHCTECGHKWIYYTTNDGEDLVDIETYAPDAINHDFDPESGSGYLEYAVAVTEINGEIFNGCANLATIILPSTVTTIWENAFFECSGLSAITLPSSLTSIGMGAFSGCFGLSAITLPSSLESIGAGAFLESGLTSITIPEGVTSIEQVTFQGCTSLGTVTFLGQVTSIGENAFFCCSSLTSLSLEYVQEIGIAAFGDCSENFVLSVPCNFTLDRDWVALPENATVNYIHKGESEIIAATPATCTEDGYEDFEGCSVCHSPLGEVVVIPAHHVFDNHTLTDEPDADGLYAYVCDRGCGAHSDERIVKGNGEGNNITLTATTDSESGTTTYSTTDDITLTDAAGFASPVPFTAASVTYERTLATGKWGTLCLPYALSEKEGYEYYELSEVSSEAVTITKIEGAVAAGTPVLVRHTDADNLSLTEQNVLVGISTNPAAAINGLQLMGTFEPQAVTTGYYLDASDNKLHSIDEYCSEKSAASLTIPAFRAWFDGTTPSGARSLGMIIDDETTSLDALRALTQGTAEIYDIYGNRRSELREGVNIVNGKKVIVK